MLMEMDKFVVFYSNNIWYTYTIQVDSPYKMLIQTWSKINTLNAHVRKKGWQIEAFGKPVCVIGE